MRAEARTFPDRGALAEAAAREVVRLAGEAIRDHGRFSIALAGGSTPRETYERLAAMGVPAAADAPRWDVFFGDERMVPRDHADSNGGMASRAWLSRSGIPATGLHFVATERGDATTAAAAY